MLGLDSGAFRSLKPSTQTVYRNIIERFCEQLDKDGNKLGDKRASTLQRYSTPSRMCWRPIRTASGRRWPV